MKRLILVMGVVAATLFVASSAMAAGLTLAWSACASDGGLSNRNSTCLTNGGAANVLVGTFQLDADIIGVTGIEVVCDWITAGGVLPAWWEFSTGACRPTSMVANPTISALAVNCSDWAGGAAAGGLAATNSSGSIAPADTAAHRRIKIGFAVASPVNVTGLTDYFAFNCLINNAKTIGTGACAGCLTPVCIVFNSINVVPGTAAGTKIGQGVTAGSNFATWQAGIGANCASVPTRNATWGQVKALYH